MSNDQQLVVGALCSLVSENNNFASDTLCVCGGGRQGIISADIWHILLVEF